MENHSCEKPIQGILCDAKQCIHHTEDDRCCAGAIQVGYKSACECNETACTTFKAKN
ncbi:MAG: DUF1540 domain-containing protein [Ruminococcaceae bacterium]|nr:DUF1540 domain-containing protein [Oscillospiraceae bacterium]